MDDNYNEIVELKSRVDNIEQAIDKLTDNILKLDTILTQIADQILQQTDESETDN